MTDIPSTYSEGLKLRIREAGDASVNFLIFDATSSRGISVAPDALAEALDGIVPGFTASYTPPIEVPQGLGALVRDHTGRWVRNLPRDSRVVDWLGDDGMWRDDSYIADRIREGAEVRSEGVEA